jgi:hypothetical protein
MNVENISKLNNIANKYGYKIWGYEYAVYISPINNNWYNAEVTITYDDNTNKLIRFNISFSGHGTLNPEHEKEYFDNLCNAKKLCDELNNEIISLNNLQNNI